MERASERLEFERAASLRDKLTRLEALKEQFVRLRFAVETLSFVYTVPGHDGDDRVYLIRRGRVRAEMRLAAVRADDAIALMALIDDVFSPVERETSQIPTHEIDELLLLSSWFRRFPAELKRTRAAVPWPVFCIASSRTYRRTAAAATLGATMATTWQPTTLVQCISLRPWLVYPGCDESGGCHDLTLGQDLRDDRRRSERRLLPHHRRLRRGLPLPGLALPGRVDVIRRSSQSLSTRGRSIAQLDDPHARRSRQRS